MVTSSKQRHSCTQRTASSPKAHGQGQGTWACTHSKGQRRVKVPWVPYKTPSQAHALWVPLRNLGSLLRLLPSSEPRLGRRRWQPATVSCLGKTNETQASPLTVSWRDSNASSVTRDPKGRGFAPHPVPLPLPCPTQALPRNFPFRVPPPH